MKLFAMLLLVLNCAAASADWTQYVQDAKAQKLMEVLQDSGVALQKTSKANLFRMDVKNLNCTYFNMAAYDGAVGGLSRMACYRDANVGSNFSRTGKLMSESRALQDALDDIVATGATEAQDHTFMDCGMGKCGGAVREIYCMVNTAIEQFSDSGRFSCNVRFVSYE